MNSRAVARSGSRLLAAFAVPFLSVLLENSPRSHFLGALAISSFFLGRLDDVLVLALLFGPTPRTCFLPGKTAPLWVVLNWNVFSSVSTGPNGAV